jgi:hypothetical protein
MKLIRAAWSIVLNGVLIILPWVVLGLFIVQFGQPFLSEFKRFLGNPVMEIQQVSEKIRDNPSEPIPYPRFRQQFERLAVRDVISDTEQRQLRHTTLNLYKGVIHRLSTSGNVARAQQTTSADTFFTLLQSPLIPSIFDRPDLLRATLREDLDRLRQARDFPYHPARGIEQFVNHADTAHLLIQSYGELYADRLTCERIAGTQCDVIFEDSVGIVGEQLSQYLNNWPTLHTSLPSEPRVMVNYLPQITDAHSALGDQVAGYLEAPPWQRHHALRASRNAYLEQLGENLRQWYLNIIQQVQTNPEQFTESTPESIRQTLTNLSQLERMIQESGTASELVEGENILSARRKLVDRLLETYHWVMASRQFNDDFSAAERGIDELKDLVSRLPGGAEQLAEQDDLIDEMVEHNESLDSALSDRNYTTLTEQLNTTLERARASNSAIGWSILLRQFIEESRNTVSQPDWQPINQSGEADYAELVRTYGEVGRQLQVQAISQSWVDRTILAMKSRRFNQLKYNVTEMLDEIQNLEMSRLVAELRDLNRLDELPEELADEPRLIVFYSALVERIKRSSTRVHDAFSGLYDQNAIQQTRWEQLDTLLTAQENLGTAELLGQLELESYVGEVRAWLNELPEDEPLTERVRSQLIARLEQFMRHQHNQLVTWIQNPERGEPSLDNLSTMTDNFIRGHQRATQITEYRLGVTPDRWNNLLEFRQFLVDISDQSQALQKGSLLGSNTAFTRWRDALSEFTFQPLPADHDLEYELSQITGVHEVVMEQARTIHRQASEDWLSGWGGRISGRDILNPWQQFLSRVIQQAGRESVRRRAQELLSDTNNQLEEWSS